MSQFDRFIDNLVEMRAHYSKQIQQSDRSINLAKDSLAHINALLVNELSGSQTFVENLSQMKSHYQSIIEENDRASGSARVQLNHINALLAKQLITQQGDKQTISLQASPVEDNLAVEEGFQSNHDSKLIDEATSETEEPEPLESFEEYLAKDSTEDFSVALTPLLESNNQELPIELEDTTKQVIKESEFVENQDLHPVTVSNNTTSGVPEHEVLVEATKKARKPLKQPLLPQYEHLSKSEAIEKLLQEEAGNILHIDDIIRYLCGELETPAFKASNSHYDF